MAQPSGQGDNCKLLSLAPELRNQIYRATLVESSKIMVESGTSVPQPPTLLQTCHRIRAEASNIYYSENQFLFRMHDFDATAHIRFFKNLAGSKHTKNFLFNQNFYSTNWANLLDWMRHAFHRQCYGPLDEYQDPTEADLPGPLNVVIPIYSLVHRLRKKPGAPWAEAEKVLEDVHAVLVTQNKAWA